MHIDRPFFNEHMIAPDSVQKLSPAVDALFVRHEILKQLEFSGSQFQWLILKSNPVRISVQNQFIQLETASRLFWRPSS